MHFYVPIFINIGKSLQYVGEKIENAQNHLKCQEKCFLGIIMMHELYAYILHMICNF